ncbi:MAG: FGGY-family carbohydrate kinase [Acidimicrobiia bacterium]
MSGDILAIDLGSSGLKVAVVDGEGRVNGSASEPLPTIFTPDGGAEQDPEHWWSALGRCSRKAIAHAGIKSGDIEAVAVTTQYMSTLAIDADGRPLTNVVMWMDSRGARFMDEVSTGENIALWIDLHGLPPMGNCDLAHIALLRHEYPDADAAAAAYVEPVDYLTARLTGRITATQNTAFPLMTVDNRTHGATSHSAELMERAGIDPAKLPPLVPFDEIIGSVTAAAAEHLGITTRACVVAGTIDSITSAVGTGALDSTSCSIVVGTTSVMVTHIDEKRGDLDHGLTSIPSPLPGRYFVMAENGVGGKALEFFLRNVVYADDAFATGGLPVDAFERAAAVAATAPPGANGVLFQPWLVGSMAPVFDHDMRGGFLGLSLTSSRADMSRAIYEGVALNFGWLLRHVSAFTGTTYGSLRFGGGGAASDFWGQVMADVMGVTVSRLSDPSMTNARGAAFLALERLGRMTLDDIPSMLHVARVHQPEQSTRALYERLGERFVEFHSLARPFYAALNDV